MSYQELVEPDRNTQGSIGFCLKFAADAFHAPHIYPTAIAAWNATQFRHLDTDFPPDAPVVLWWEYQDAGHVAINIPGLGILSSPWKRGTTQAVLGSLAEIERIYHLGNFLGWTEDIEGLRVAQPQEDDVVKIEDAINWYNRCNITYRATRGRELDRDTFVSFVGKEFLTFVEYCEDDPEAATVSNWQSVGQQAVTENWQQQITNLAAELKEAQDKPAPEPQVITKTVQPELTTYTLGQLFKAIWQKIANK